MAAWTLLALPVAMMGLGFPVFIALLGTAAIVMILFMNVPLVALHQSMFGSVESFALLAIPFFIFAGELMARGSVARRVVTLVGETTGSVRGKVGYTQG